MQKAGDQVRVNVQLIDARADSHLWAKSYDRDIKDVFAVESEVAQEIADSLQAKLSPAEADKLPTAPTKDPVAYDLFLKGEYESRLMTVSLKVESFDQAATWYEQAIARPEFRPRDRAPRGKPSHPALVRRNFFQRRNWPKLKV
ncbi:MAG: hypothetical protein H0X40_09740 [Chthoniobacterales bacterium]|nr:hypothetical protein [Chthoniobacterales bacterium]